MKFHIQRQRLNQALQDVYRAVSSRTPIPILSGIKLQLEESGLRLTGSDSDMTIETFLPVVEGEQSMIRMEQTGSVVLPSKYLGEVIRKLPNEEVTIEVNQHFGAKITSGTAQFTLNGLDPAEYPKLPSVAEEHSFKLPTDVLRKMILQTAFAASSSESRPILTGVAVQIEQEKIRFLATDSHRFAQSEAVLEQVGMNGVRQAVVPAKSLEELTKVFDDSEGIELTWSKSHVMVRNQNILFLSRLLDGSYPDTSRIVPTQTLTDLVADNRSLTSAVERASLLAREGKNNIVRLHADSTQLEIECQVPEVGEVREVIPVEMLKGDAYHIAINAKYLLDALHALQGDDVQLSYTGAMSPFLLRKSHSHESLQLVLPVRI